MTTFPWSKVKNKKKKLKLLEYSFICDQPQLSSFISLDAAPVWMQKGRKRNSHFCHFWESCFWPFCIQTGAASKLVMLESSGWSQMKAYSKSFNFFFLFLIFDLGKVVKLDVNECVLFIVRYSKCFYSKRIWLVAFATELSSYIRYALRQNSVHFAKKFPKWKMKIVW